jgi:hypothetical protein
MVLAIVGGLVSGILGFLPLMLGLRITHKKTFASTATSMLVLFGALFVSFVLMFLLAVLCISIDKSLALPFVFAEVIALCVSAISYGIHSNRKTD